MFSSGTSALADWAWPPADPTSPNSLWAIFPALRPETGIAEDDNEPMVVDSGGDAPRRFGHFQKKVRHLYQGIGLLHHAHMHDGDLVDELQVLHGLVEA